MNFSARSIAALASVTLLTPSLLHGQETPGNVTRPGSDTPRVELFTGFSYLRGAPSLQPGNRLSGLYGGSTSVAFNLNRSFGLVTDFSGYRNTELGLIGPGALPNRVVKADGTAYSLLFGPRFSYRKHDRFVPFAQVLVGGIQASKVNISGCTGTGCTPLPEQGSFALTAGGGFDIKLQRHVAFRLVQAEYMMTRFADVTSGVRTGQNDLRLSSGLVFRFGRIGGPVLINHAPTVACSTDRASVPAGSEDAIALRAQANDLDGNALTYAWSASGGTVEGTGAEARWKSAGSPAGIYTVGLLVDDGHGGVGHCSSNVRVEPQPNHPPTLTCSADRPSVTAGEAVQITASGTDADNDPVVYSWESTGGRVVGSGPAVRFDSTGVSAGQYVVTGHASDGRGGVANCSVNVAAKAPISAEVVRLEGRLALHSIYFPTAKPGVNDPNGGLLASQKQTLVTLAGDFKKYLEARPDAHLTLEGHSDPRATPEYNQELSARRVERTKSFLVENGVPAAAIQVKAFGESENLTEAQVREAIQNSSDLPEADRAKVLANMTTIVLASNRRVDVVLSTTGEQSARKYPFNAADSATLLKQEGTPKAAHRTRAEAK